MSETTHAHANPAPLGLLGFGMATALLQLHNIGLFHMSVAIIALGLFVGGLAQVIAGLMEFRYHNTFGATAFTSYGLFWWALCFILVNPLGDDFALAGSDLGWFFVLWGVYTLFMFVGTLKQTRTNQLVFGTLTILFFLLAAGNFAPNATLTLVTGAEGLVCACFALYGAFGQVVNEVYGRTVMPL